MKKLTPVQVEEARRLYTTTNLSQRAIAKRLGVSPSYVSRKIRELWKKS